MTDQKISFEELMEKFHFHHNAVTHHAHMAKKLGEMITENYEEEARSLDYFTEEFFNETKNKADGEEDSAFVSDETPQASESAAASH